MKNVFRFRRDTACKYGIHPAIFLTQLAQWRFYSIQKSATFEIMKDKNLYRDCFQLTLSDASSFFGFFTDAMILQMIRFWVSKGKIEVFLPKGISNTDCITHVAIYMEESVGGLYSPEKYDDESILASPLAEEEYINVK